MPYTTEKRSPCGITARNGLDMDGLGGQARSKEKGKEPINCILYMITAQPINCVLYMATTPPINWSLLG